MNSTADADSTDRLPDAVSVSNPPERKVSPKKQNTKNKTQNTAVLVGKVNASSTPAAPHARKAKYEGRGGSVHETLTEHEMLINLVTTSLHRLTYFGLEA